MPIDVHVPNVELSAFIMNKIVIYRAFSHYFLPNVICFTMAMLLKPVVLFDPPDLGDEAEVRTEDRADHRDYQLVHAGDTLRQPLEGEHFTFVQELHFIVAVY